MFFILWVTGTSEYSTRGFLCYACGILYLRWRNADNFQNGLPFILHSRIWSKLATIMNEVDCDN